MGGLRERDVAGVGGEWRNRARDGDKEWGRVVETAAKKER